MLLAAVVVLVPEYRGQGLGLLLIFERRPAQQALFWLGAITEPVTILHIPGVILGSSITRSASLSCCSTASSSRCALAEEAAEIHASRAGVFRQVVMPALPSRHAAGADDLNVNMEASSPR